MASVFSTSRIQRDFPPQGALKACWGVSVPTLLLCFQSLSLSMVGGISSQNPLIAHQEASIVAEKQPKDKKIGLWLQKRLHPKHSDLGQYSGEFLIK